MDKSLDTMEEEDTHYCLRCRLTIIGLDNYVHHRRQKCHSSTKQQDRIIPNNTSYLSMARNNSSSSIRNYLHVPSKSSNRSDPILSSSSNHMEECYKSRHVNENPLVSDLSVENAADDFMSHLGLCMVSSTTWANDINSEEPLRADDFFSLLELQSCKGTESNRQRSRRSIEPLVPSTDSLKSETESMQTDDPNDSNFPLVETTDLNSSRDSAATELASNEDITDNSALVANDVTSSFSSPELATNSEVPSSEMKINPSNETVTDTTTDDLCISSQQPTKLPYPSRGKWMPGLKPRVIHKAGSSVEYHCKPCNRRLTGRVVFEKHLQSELHFKRTAQQLTTSDGSKYGLRRNKPDVAPVDLVEQEIDALQDDEDVDDPWWINKQKKRAERSAQRCPTCSVWVPKPHFGKHLVSRYHVSRCRKHPARDSCILENIHVIVLEAPFQCRLCRFYCHCHADLLTHWNSAQHLESDRADSVRRSGGTYFCSLCRIGQLDNDSMKIHLESESHLSCVRIVHKSVAVIVSKLEPIHCHLCTAKDSPVNFRYRIALNKHLTLDHAVPSDMLTQYSSQTYSCTYCDFSTLSNWSFTHHRFSCQAAPSDETRYRCLICNLGFCTKAEVTKHRSTQEHRDVATKKRGSYGATVRLRSCPHCYKQFTDLASLKNHFISDHPDLLPRCIRCGTTFALKQQLSAHRRAGCQATESSESLALGCVSCSYKCRLKVELLYHQAVEHPKQSGKPSNERADATAVKYRCPECDQLYSSTAALKLHLQSHTGELAFRCHFCGRHFEREEERLAHIRQLHAPRPTIKGQSMVAREENGRAKGRDTHFKSSSSRTGAHVHPDNAE